ncbi:MAG: diguanylate cyclase [Sedimenticola sp.]
MPESGRFKTLRPRLFLGLSFAVFIGLMLTITTIALMRMTNISGHMEKVVERYTLQASLMMNMRTAARERIRLLHNMLITDDPFEADEHFMLLREKGEEFLKNLAKLETMDLSPDSRALLDAQREPTRIGGELHYEVIDRIQQGKFDEANRILVDQTTPAQDQALGIMDQFIHLQRAKSRQSLSRATQELHTTYTQLFILAGVAMALGLGLAVFVIYRIGALLDAHRQHSHELQHTNKELELTNRELEEEVSERLQVLDELRDSEEMGQAVIENMLDGLITIDEKGIIQSCNRAVLQLFGYEQAELLGQNVSLLMPEPFRSQHDQYLGNYHTTGEAKIIGIGRELPGLHKDGSQFPLELGVTDIELSKQRIFVGVLHDIADRKKAEESQRQAMQELERRVEERTVELRLANKALTRLANYDSLTGLPNRTLFSERLKMAMAHARRNRCRIALLFMDLDGFKEVNDRHGHESGDLVLQETAKRLQNCLREEDTVGRMGGDEFTVILNNLADREDAAGVAEKLIQAIDEPYEIADEIQQIGISIGVAIYPEDTEVMDTLMQYADDAMYRVKRSGKNSFRYYSIESEES